VVGVLDGRLAAVDAVRRLMGREPRAEA